MSLPGSTSRDASAYSSVVRTRSAFARAEVSHATTRRENASRIAESHNGPSPVEIIVRSVTHSRFGAGAVKSLLTRSGARVAFRSRRVKPFRRGLTPARSASRISRSTRLRPTGVPSRFSTACTRGEP
jgi:hypothetical protein